MIALFEYGSDSLTLGRRWESWLERFKAWMEISSIEDGKKKKTFILMLGEETFEIWKSLRKENDSDSLDEAYTKLTEHFVTKRCEFTETCVFRRQTQGEGETMQSFEVRLRALAKYCKFADVDKEILIQLVAGSNSEQFKAKCCAKEDLKLKDALAIARTLERSAADVNGLTQPTAAELERKFSLNYASTSAPNRAKPKPSSDSPYCNHCGYEKHGHNKKCPAKGKKCDNCGKMNHYATVCMGPKKDRGQGSHPRRGTESSSQNQDETSRPVHRKVDHSGKNAANINHLKVTLESDPKSAQKRPAVVSEIWQNGKRVSPSLASKSSNETTIEVNADEYAEFLCYKANAGENYDIYQVVGDEVQNDGPRVEIEVAGSKVDFLIDTGAPLNIIDEVTFTNLRFKPVLRPCSSKVFGYEVEDAASSSTTTKPKKPLPILGQFVAKAAHNGIEVTAGFIVVKGRGEKLLSYRTAKALKLIQVLCQIVADPIDELNRRFPNAFSGKMGQAKDFEVKLEVDPTVRGVRQKLRPIAFGLRDAVENEIRRQVAEGILEPVHDISEPTPFISNLVVVLKSTDPIDVRLTADSRWVNKAIKRTRHWTRTIEDVVYIVNGAKFFSKLDLKKAFHQLLLAKESRYLTVITTHIGLFRYRCLHMGISSASEIFAEFIRNLISDIPGTLNMIDDILVFGHTEAEHKANLLKLLQRLEDTGLTLNVAKCEFYKKEVIFFGLKLSEHGISPTIEKCSALRNAKPPTNASELRSFLGLAQYVSRFIQDFAIITAVLWKLTKKSEKWKWGSEEQMAFDRLKEAITTKALSYFDKTLTTSVMVDASPVGLAAVIVQSKTTLHENPNQDKFVVAFASRLLSDVERKYSQCEKESLAIVWGCERFWLYLYAIHFYLYSDNRAAEQIFQNPSSKPPPRIERMNLRMTPFHVTVIHQPGRWNVADYFSRHPIDPVDGKSAALARNAEIFLNYIVSSVTPNAISLDQIAQATSQDPDLQMLKKWVEANSDQKVPAKLRAFKNIKDELSWSTHGVLLRGQRIIVPTSLRQRTIALAHLGHQGIVKTKALMREKLWFPGMDRQIEDWITRCLECQASGTKQCFEPLRTSPMPAGPWLELSCDFFGPLENGQGHWLVISDDYSRYVIVKRVPSTSSEAVIPVIEDIFSMFGTPIVVRTDNGPPFFGQCFANFAKRLGFRHRKITPQWPRANGEIERFMKNLGKVVRNARVSGTGIHEELQRFLRVYRETPHSTTKVSPSKLLFGYARTSGLPGIPSANHSTWHEQATANDAAAKKAMEDHYNAVMKAKLPQIRIGSSVLLKLERTIKSTPSWDPNPYTVIYINGSCITARRNDHYVTRNSSFFKPIIPSEDDDQASPPNATEAVSAPNEGENGDIAVETAHEQGLIQDIHPLGDSQEDTSTQDTSHQPKEDTSPEDTTPMNPGPQVHNLPGQPSEGQMVVAQGQVTKRGRGRPKNSADKVNEAKTPKAPKVQATPIRHSTRTTQPPNFYQAS